MFPTDTSKILRRARITVLPAILDFTIHNLFFALFLTRHCPLTNDSCPRALRLTDKEQRT